MKFRMLFKYWIFFCFSIFAAVPAWAVNNDPMDMLQTTSQQMIGELKANKASLKSNSQLVYSIINRLLLPHVDIIGMARSVLGRQAWTDASEVDRGQFVKEFTQLLVRTYASAFAAYDNQEVKFLPMREPLAAQTRVQIDSMIVQPNGPQIPVSYRLAKLQNDWKVYDINVDGISLLQSYRSQFTQELSQNTLPVLIQKLQKQNIGRI